MPEHTLACADRRAVAYSLTPGLTNAGRAGRRRTGRTATHHNRAREEGQQDQAWMTRLHHGHGQAGGAAGQHAAPSSSWLGQTMPTPGPSPDTVASAPHAHCGLLSCFSHCKTFTSLSPFAPLASPGGTQAGRQTTEHSCSGLARNAQDVLPPHGRDRVSCTATGVHLPVGMANMPRILLETAGGTANATCWESPRRRSRITHAHIFVH